MSADQESITGALRLKQILVPYDFSEGAQNALRQGISLAQQYQATLTLLHVVHLPFRGVNLGLSEPHGTEGILQAETSVALSALAHDLKGDGLEVRSVVQPGLPAHEIVDLARRELVDLIVMGTKGRTGLAHALLGSVAEHVVRHAPCPVLVVRNRPSELEQKSSSS